MPPHDELRLPSAGPSVARAERGERAPAGPAFVAADETDPLEAVAVSCPAGPEALEAMATAFVEEFLSQGLPPERVVALFRDPFYAAPHGVWRARGEAYVRSLVARALRPGRSVRGG